MKKTLKEIYTEAKRFCPDNEVIQEAFVQGVRWALYGRYYKEKNIFDKEGSETVDLEVIEPETEIKIPTFDDWWNTFNKKRGRKKAEAKWNKLSDKDKVACMNATPIYVASIEDKQFQKDPLTYLNGECWNDEIINKKNHEQQRAIDLASKAARILSDTNNPR